MAEEGREGQPAPADRGDGIERRAAPRYQADLRVTCYPADGSGTGRTVRMRNISLLGFGLIVDRHWGPGTALNVQLPLDPEGSTRLCRARVVHATAQPGGCFLVGCVFETPLGSDELRTLVGGPV